MSFRYLGSDPGDSGDSFDLLLPDYSGDGFRNSEFEAPFPGDGIRSSKLGAPVFGDETRSPQFDAPSFRDEFPSAEFDASSSRYRYADHSLSDVGQAENVQLTLARARVVELPFAPLVTKPTPSNESWKLAGLVVIFLIWVSTASTLLFLYMDRYLFG
ncbi:MAG: hypothetical protein BMS9Abin05_1015 [Rhodothermia bacterium]|nr:MAG: hypothetical protein BMS9Abin05_1015 [Rhodothermia bacterium]